jgi:methylenetetrahydrofolate dehydrogenase (NADP+)/methenyltetrahydrofolate cyclohydrolase
VKNKVADLVRKPRIVSILVGDNPASALYTRLKKQAAERVGIEFDVQHLDKDQLVDQVRQISENYDGIMIQLPIAGLQGQALKDVLSAIPLEKDVDGLRWEESGMIPATVRAVLSLVDEIAKDKTIFAVLGSRGAVGRPLVHFLNERGLVVSEIEVDTKNPEQLIHRAEVVISCVGKAELVTAEMVSDGLIAIDVGMSELEGKVVGDMTQEVYQKASVAVPVPGGVGPVTVASLMQNALSLL